MLLSISAVPILHQNLDASFEACDELASEHAVKKLRLKCKLVGLIFIGVFNFCLSRPRLGSSSFIFGHQINVKTIYMMLGYELTPFQTLAFSNILYLNFALKSQISMLPLPYVFVYVFVHTLIWNVIKRVAIKCCFF